MVTITEQQMMQLIYRNGHLFVPQCIENAVIKTVENSIDKGSDIESIAAAGQTLSADYTRTYNGPIRPDYSKIETVDAYTLFYTRRNSLIPRITLKDILLNTNLQTLPAEIRILDIGSGTGAIILGFLELFSQPLLRNIKVHVVACDKNNLMLKRQDELIAATNLNPATKHNINCNLSNIVQLNREFNKYFNYDFIFAGNVFTELDNTEAIALLKCVSQYLTDKGIIAIVDAQRNHMKQMMPILVNTATQQNLTTFYPCPPNRARACNECWYWREYTYNHQNIKIKGRLLNGAYREELIATWLILSKSPNTIYDNLVSQYSQLSWGPISYYGRDSINDDKQICMATTQIYGLQDKRAMKRGSIVGGQGTPFNISQYKEL